VKKKLNETEIVNELRDASAYFRRPPAAEDEGHERDEGAGAPEPKARQPALRTRKARAANATLPTAASARAENEAPDVEAPDVETPDVEAPAPTLEPDERIEMIRKAVKQLGKESTFSRFTRAEKDALGDVVYHYKRNGIRTSENEVIRIAVNWLLEDYRNEGQRSVLAKVLGKLNM
jgi:hypothetical protein